MASRKNTSQGSQSPSTLSRKDNIFGITATVSKENCLNAEYSVIIMVDQKEELASLQRMFLTAIEKDGVTASWEEVKSCLKVGCEIKVDVTKCKPFSKTKWLVFGLYLGGSQSVRREESSCLQRMGYSKEFDWIKKNSKQVDSITPSFSSLETKLSNIEESVLNYSNELDNTEKALVEDRESLDKAKMEAMPSVSKIKDSSRLLNETFTFEESVVVSPSTLQNSKCQHQYEVGIVVISVEKQQLQMVGPMNNIWVKIDVDLDCVPVFVARSRVTNFREVKVGFMGTVIMDMCVNCQLDRKVECLTKPMLLWLGEEPDIRGETGVMVWREDEKMLVMVESGQPVMFRDHHNCHNYDKVATDEKLKVWAWGTKLGMCAEGAIWIVQQRDEVNEGIPTSEASLSKEELDISLGTGSVEDEDGDKGSNISFGSVSECCEVDMNKSVNSNLATLLKFSPFKRINIDYPEDSKISYPCSSSLQDEEIEKEFEKVMSANDLGSNHDDLVNKYEDYYRDSQLPNVVQQHVVDIPVSSEKFIDADQCPPPSPQVDLLENPSDVSFNSFFTRRQSSSPLSPIPEEPTENILVFTPISKPGNDSGYNGSFLAGTILRF